MLSCFKKLFIIYICFDKVRYFLFFCPVYVIEIIRDPAYRDIDIFLLFGLMIYKACFEKLYRIIAYKDHIV